MTETATGYTTAVPLCDDCADELLPDPHAGHELAKARVWRAAGAEIGFLACLDCAVLLRPLALCGARTRRGTRCRVLVRDDPGERRCRQHAEGRASQARRSAPTPALPERRSPASGLFVGGRLPRSGRGRLC